MESLADYFWNILSADLQPGIYVFILEFIMLTSFSLALWIISTINNPQKQIVARLIWFPGLFKFEEVVEFKPVEDQTAQVRA
jgi:hypothetical protein